MPPSNSEVPIGRDETMDKKNHIAERHKISKARLEAARAKAVEVRKNRRLSAPASLQRPGGRIIARQTRLRVMLTQDSETDTDRIVNTKRCDDVRAQPPNTETPPEATPTSVNEARSKSDISANEANVSSSPAPLHSASREYIEHGLKLSHMSIDNVVEEPQCDITNICHIFQECNFEGGEEDNAFDAPLPALTASLDNDCRDSSFVEHK